MADTLCKDLNARHGVGRQMIGIETKRGAEGAPQSPSSRRRVYSLGEYTSGSRLQNSAPVGAEFISGDRVEICQGQASEGA